MKFLFWLLDLPQMPKKLWRHIGRFGMVFCAFRFGDLVVSTCSQFGILEHPGIVEFILGASFAIVSAWFVWRGYTGLFRDCDFYEDWDY